MVVYIWLHTQSAKHLLDNYKRLNSCLSETLAYLSFGDIHEDGKAGHVVTLAADVCGVPEGQFTAFRGP